MITNSGVTIFNKIIDPTTRNEVLKRAYIYNVLYTESHGANIISSGLESADAVKIYIPLESLKNASKEAVKPENFEDPETQFTLTRGSIIVKGIHEEDFTTVRELEKKHSQTYKITTVDVRTFGSERLWHIEVGGE